MGCRSAIRHSLAVRCDVWDIERDALNWHGGCPVVAHPPCRAWGRLRHFARPRDGERELALWAVKMGLTPPSRADIEAKKLKVQKFLAYSAECGCVDSANTQALP